MKYECQPIHIGFCHFVHIFDMFYYICGRLFWFARARHRSFAHSFSLVTILKNSPSLIWWKSTRFHCNSLLLLLLLLWLTVIGGAVKCLVLVWKQASNIDIKRLVAPFDEKAWVSYGKVCAHRRRSTMNTMNIMHRYTSLAQSLVWDDFFIVMQLYIVVMLILMLGLGLVLVLGHIKIQREKVREWESESELVWVCSR